MKRFSFAHSFFIPLFLLMLLPLGLITGVQTASAQDAIPTPAPYKTKVIVKPKPSVETKARRKSITTTTTSYVTPGSAGTSANSKTTSPNAKAKAAAPVPVVAATPAAEPAPPPIPWKLIYYVEYQGPRISNIDFSHTEDDQGNTPYAEFDHSFKLGYAVSKNVVIGTQLRAISPLDPTANFTVINPRLYFSWAHMIETPDLDIQGILDLEAPTTDVARGKGMLFATNLNLNWVLKTSLRNWFFSVYTRVRPIFYNDPVGNANTDLHIEADPWITVDIAPSWQILFEGYFSAAHSATENFYNLNQDDADTIDIGPLWSINSHLQLYPAIRFFTGNLSFKAADFYFNFTASL